MTLKTTKLRPNWQLKTTLRHFLNGKTHEYKLTVWILYTTKIRV